MKFLRILNIDDGEIVENDLKYITDAVHHGRLSRSQLAKGDVLMTITGRVGSAAVVGSEHLPANINQHVARLRIDTNRCRPAFLAEWLNCPAGLDLSNRYVSGGTRFALNYEAIRNIRIPLPTLQFQDEILNVMGTARVERKAKLAEADALLVSLDDFLLDTLGINPDPPQKRVFAVRASDLRSSRFDPDFHSLKFRTIRNSVENGRYPSKRIAELCQSIRPGFAAGRQNQAFDYESGIPHLRPLNIDVFGQIHLEGTKFVPKESTDSDRLCVSGEVLFNNTNSTGLVGKSAVFNLDQPCACSNHVTRLLPGATIDGEYIAAVFNALRRIGYLGLLSTNFNNQAGINATTLSGLRIPQPPMVEQRRIAAEIRRRRQQARHIRSEAEQSWQAARRRFEEALLSSA